MDLLYSKKFRTALLTTLGLVAVHFGAPETKVEEMIALAAPFLTYIFAQGQADKGKEQAAVEALAAEEAREAQK